MEVDLTDARSFPDDLERVVTPYSEVVARLRARMVEEAISEDELGDRVGWELDSLLDNPSSFADLPIFGLRWICREVGVDWATTLSNVTARPRPASI
jgi:hypothetical protein